MANMTGMRGVTVNSTLGAMLLAHFARINNQLYVDARGVYITLTGNPPTNGSDVVVVNWDGTTSKAVWLGKAIG